MRFSLAYMARVRAIEGGFTLLRAVRWAPSAAFDAHGRVHAWMPATDDTDGVMVTHVPVGRTPTTLVSLGDRPVALAALLLVVLLLMPRRWMPDRYRSFASASRITSWDGTPSR
jgi:apolipoprotein N-acyltransferase